MEQVAEPSSPGSSYPGTIFLDSRGSDRAMKVTWHREASLVVLSLWRGNVCTGSFRLTVEEVPELVALLRAGLDRSYAEARDLLGAG